MAGDVDGDPGRQVAGVVGEIRPLALAPDDQARRRLDLDLDVEVEGQGQGVEAGAEVGRRRRGPGAHDRQNRRCHQASGRRNGLRRAVVTAPPPLGPDG